MWLLVHTLKMVFEELETLSFFELIPKPASKKRGRKLKLKDETEQKSKRPREKSRKDVSQSA